MTGIVNQPGARSFVLGSQYEEGVWTPSEINHSSGSLSTAEGSYIKIGKLCHLNFKIVCSSLSGGTFIMLAPFKNGPKVSATVIYEESSLYSVNRTHLAIRMDANSFEMKAWGIARNYTAEVTSNDSVTNGTYIASITYETV